MVPRNSVHPSSILPALLIFHLPLYTVQYADMHNVRTAVAWHRTYINSDCTPCPMTTSLQQYIPGDGRACVAALAAAVLVIVVVGETSFNEYNGIVKSNFELYTWYQVCGYLSLLGSIYFPSHLLSSPFSSLLFLVTRQIRCRETS